MIEVLPASLVIIAVVMAGIGVGVMVTSKRLRGSCGGVGPGGCACTLAKRRGCPVGKAAQSTPSDGAGASLGG